MNLKKTYVPKIGYTEICKTGDSSLKMLDFGMVELKKGDSVTIETGEKEFAFIILSGHADFAFDDTKWENVGGRARCLRARQPAPICRGTKCSPSPAVSM